MNDSKVVPIKPNEGRKLHSWIDTFQDYMKPFDVPPLFATWTALVTLAGAVERKLWHITNKGELYPNLYALLLGPAAAGKTVAIHEGRRLLKELKDVHLAASNVSSASFIDELDDAIRRHTLERGAGIDSFNALTVMSNEFGVFLPVFDPGFLAILTDMWDGKGFSERKRKFKDKKIDIPKSTVSILAGWTPSSLKKFLPDGAWEQGIMSRIPIIYSGNSDPQDLWSNYPGQSELFKVLVHDLEIIHKMYGPVVFAPDAQDAIKEWHLRRGPPAPEHHLLITYTQRRTAMLIKLCILCSASESDTRIITLEQYQHALNILLSTEVMMPDAFKAMATGGDINVMREVRFILLQEYMRSNQKPIPLRLVISLLMERTPAHNVQRLLDVMVTTQWLKEENNINTGKTYIPLGKKPGE